MRQSLKLHCATHNFTFAIGKNFTITPLVKWEDIELVSVSPYLDNTYWIHIYLKNPSEYIKNARTLEKLEKQAKHHNAGHICFTSLYFKKEINEVSALIEYYIEHNNPCV